MFKHLGKQSFSWVSVTCLQSAQRSYRPGRIVMKKGSIREKERKEEMMEEQRERREEEGEERERGEICSNSITNGNV